MREKTPSESGSNASLLVAVTAANFAQFGSRIVISPFVLVIVATFGVSKGEIGAALTGMWAAVAVMQFPGGVLADKYGEKPIILLSMGLTAIGSALVATAPSFGVFVLAVIAVGIGAGLYFAVGTALLTRRVRRRGRAFGIHSAGGPTAGLVVPVVATAVALRYDWRAGVAVGGVVALLAFVLVARTVGRAEPVAPESRLRQQLHPRRITERLTRPGVPFTTLLAVFGMYAFQAFASFFPAFLVEYHGFAEGPASVAFGAAFALIAFGLAVVGTLADRYGTLPGIAIPFLVAAAGMALLVMAGSRPVVYMGLVVMGVGFTWAGPLQSRFMAQFPAAERASGFGMVRTVFVLVGSLGSVVTGVLADAVGWGMAYGVVAVLLAIAGILVVGDAVRRRPDAVSSSDEGMLG